MKIEITATAKNGLKLVIIGKSNSKGNFVYSVDNVSVDVKFNTDLKKHCVFFPKEISIKYFGVSIEGCIPIDYKESLMQEIALQVFNILEGKSIKIEKASNSQGVGSTIYVDNNIVNGQIKDSILFGGIQKTGIYIMTKKGLPIESNIVFEKEMDDNDLIFGKGNW